MPNIYVPCYTDLEAGLSFPTTFSAGCRLAIRNHDGRIIKPFGNRFFKNLITNYGLDQGCQGSGIQNTLSSGTSYCNVGTSTTPPANSDIKLGTWAKQSSSQQASGASYTNDTTNGAITATQTYSFATESSTVTYNEIGIAFTNSQTTTLMTHALISPGVTLTSGQQLLVNYTFTESIPCLITPITVSMSPVNSFDVSGQMKVCGLFSNIFGTLASSGVWSGGVTAVALHTGGGAGNAGALMSAPTSFPSVNTALTETVIAGGTGSTVTYSTYTFGSFVRTATYVFPVGCPTATASNVNMIRLCYAGQAGNGLYLLLTAAQTKNTTMVLTIGVGITMARG